MSNVSISSSHESNNFPLPTDLDFANQKLDDFLEIYNDAHVIEIKKIIENKSRKTLLLSIFSNSPYLTQLIFKHPVFFLDVLQTSAEDIIEELFCSLKGKFEQYTNQSELMRDLRIAKARLALTTAIADLTGDWKLKEITNSLSRFAEISLELSVNFLLLEGIRSGDLSHIENNDQINLNQISQNSGYVILAMGKLGGYELNYSSDIDLIVLYDKDIIKYSGRRSPQDFFIKITKKLVKIMADRTADGYVFRTDLQLRPDPGATPVAISMDGAEFYYQSMGLNWERAAMIKARPIAGDIKSGYDFLKRINGFIWRKHLDYAAIDDIHAIKNLIHKHHKHGHIKLVGHDVKLGRGGIREIEFYAQIHQLISGGREPALRIPPTCQALDALCNEGKLSKDDNKTLQSAYVYLRTLEHRLQMINDDQTHLIPTSKDEIERISKFMGYEDRKNFREELMGHLNAVHALFNNLLKDSNLTDETDNSLSFPPDTYHPDTISAIEKAGFKDAKKIYDLIKNWQLGRYRSCRTDRARLLLKQLLPDILHAFGHHNEPDAAFVKFDDFLAKLPSGVQLFSFIKAQPWLLELLALITGIAPFLSDQLSRQPLLLDSVLNVDFFEQNSSFEKLSISLNEQLHMARDFQDILDVTRKWANEGKFQIGLQLLRHNTDVVRFGKTLADIAEVSLIALLDEVKNEFAKKHGVIKNSSLCILAMGKLGGHEFTTTSDVDMVLIYDAEDMDTVSDGQKQLSVNHYFARLSQNFINSITALTGEGKLYEVDMRLRPSGTAGPLAVSIDGFNEYQSGQAWTWEHMALSRARVISGSDILREKIETGILGILSHKGRDQDNLLHEVAKMRQRLIDNFTTKNIWAMKHTRGGIVDVEFICQYLLLKHGSTHPEILEKNTLCQIKKLSEANILSDETGEKFSASLQTLQSIQAILRLCLGSTSQDNEKSPALRLTISEQINCKPDEIENIIIEKRKFIHQLYDEIIEIPAAKMLPIEPVAPLDHSRK